MKLRPRPGSKLATRVAFGVIVVFVLAQAVWWVIFQRSYITRATDTRLEAWALDARTAQRALEAAAGDAAVRRALLEDHPHLVFEGGTFAVDDAAREAYLAEQDGYRRMLAFEGPVFVLVVVALLAFIGRSLREERDLKRRQQNFVAAVTHEFKTPLSTLRLLVQTAQLRDLGPERRRAYLERMAGEVDRLERTSERVLAAARLEGAAVAPALASHDLNDTTARVVEDGRGGLQARGAELRFEPADEPLPVSIDPDAFALILTNLLDNAVKHAPGDGARVTVRLERRGDLALLHVDDAGPGVPPSERGRIFERFYRSGDELTRGADGVGLGLHLVRTAVEAMNGWVRVEDAPDGGARFTVVLPRRVSGRAADASAAAPATEAS